MDGVKDAVATGGGQCGAVRYALYVAPRNSHVCHCRMCQRATGGLFAALVGAPKADFAWTKGEPGLFASSNLASRAYCRDCGTPLGSRLVRVMMPVDLRSPGDERLPATNVVAMVNLDRRPGWIGNWRRALRLVSWETWFLKRFRFGLSFIRGLAVCERLPGGLGMFCRPDCTYATAVLSNLGKVFETPNLVREGGRVMQEEALVRDGDDVVVEDALVDDGGALLGEDDAVEVEAVEAGDGLAGLERLPRGVLEGPGGGPVAGVHAVDEEVDAGPGVGGVGVVEETGVVGGALVAVGVGAGEGRVVDEAGLFGEDGPQDAGRDGGLDGAVEHGPQVGGREVGAVVGGVDAGGDGGGVGDPHARGGGDLREQHGVIDGGPGDHLGVGPLEAQGMQRGQVGALVGREDALGDAQLDQPAHLGEALEGGVAGA